MTLLSSLPKNKRKWQTYILNLNTLRVRALAWLVVFLGKTLLSQNAPLHPGVYVTGEFNAGGNPAMD